MLNGRINSTLSEGENDGLSAITLNISNESRAAAAGGYQEYKTPLLTTSAGATSKELPVRDEDAQVLHGFTTSCN